MSKVAVVGLGYVGLPLAIRAAEVGHSVVGIDLDIRKVNSLNAGQSYVEDVTDEQLAAAAAAGTFVAVTDAAYAKGFDIAIIAVPTPLREGTPDLSYVVSAGEMIGKVLSKGGTVVLESTTYPGTTEGLLRNTLEKVSELEAGVDFHLGFSPERIDPGNKVDTLQTTPKLVSGTTAAALDVIKRFYDTIVDTTVPVSSPRVAELSKVFENTQANVLIALANEMARICHDLDIDVHEMIDASMTKGHSMSRWLPGPGVGGHCLPIDPMYLAWQTRSELGYPFRFAELADSINNGRPYYVVDRAAEALERQGKELRGSEVLVLGVAYKPNVGDVRESPAIPIVDLLTSRGAKVTVVDPHVADWSTTPTLALDEMTLELGRFPLVINVTNHAEFDYKRIALDAQYVLDCRNSMTPGHTVEAL